MIEPTPFAYPVGTHQRRHGPTGYGSYQGYKPWLRDEFAFRCVYCLEREAWYPDRADSFSVDHVIPQSEDAALVLDYTNLMYACTRCNSARSAVRVLDPTAVPFGEHVQLGEGAELVGRTVEGKDLIDLLHLNENPALTVRRKFLAILSLKQRYPDDPEADHLYRQAFGFPEDMPDLRTMRPPRGNSVPGSERDCHFARRERGELSDLY